MRLSVIIVSIVMAASLLAEAPRALSAGTEACGTLTESAAFQRLSQARGIITESVMYERTGEIPELLQAYRCLSASADAIGHWERILTKGSLSAQLLALAALHELAPEKFRRWAARYRSSSDSVPLLALDVSRTIEVATVLQMIEAGKYSALLTSTEQQGGYRRSRPAPDDPR